MNVDFENTVSFLEVEENFLEIAQLVDEKGMVVITKNDAPRYVMVDCTALTKNAMADQKDLREAALKILEEYRKTFEELE